MKRRCLDNLLRKVDKQVAQTSRFSAGQFWSRRVCQTHCMVKSLRTRLSDAGGGAATVSSSLDYLRSEVLSDAG